VKLALIGTHGVGKTTLCFELAARLKRRSLDVEIVREVARRCPLPINEQTTVRAQEWILLTQMALEIEASAAHEIVLCDRSVLDNYCYLVHAAGPQPLWERVLDDWLPTYDLLAWVPQWSQATYDGVRAVEPGFQRRIDDLLGGMVEARRLAPLRLAPDRRDLWADDIIEAILPVIEPTLPLFPAGDA
jgi:nicotinamide riboside kinase